MERKLISSRHYVAIITILGVILMLVFFQLEYTDKNHWRDTLFLAFFELVACIGLWWTFALKHPVYFDDTNVYWGKPGNERYTPIASIKSISYNYDLGSKYVWIKYADADNKIKTLRFYVTGNWRKPHIAFVGMNQFQNYVKQKYTAVEIRRPWT